MLLPFVSQYFWENLFKWHGCRVNFARKIFFSYEFSYEKCSDISSKCLEPLFGVSEKSREIPSKFPIKFPSEKAKKNHRRASAGAQGEKSWWLWLPGCPTLLCPARSVQTATQANNASRAKMAALRPQNLSGPEQELIDVTCSVLRAMQRVEGGGPDGGEKAFSFYEGWALFCQSNQKTFYRPAKYWGSFGWSAANGGLRDGGLSKSEDI